MSAHIQQQAWMRVLSAFIIITPISLLLIPHSRFAYDWENHLWYIAYYGQYFHDHLSFPEYINSAHAVGVPQPLFYGYLLFPILGLLASFIGASLALKLGIACATIAEYHAVSSLCNRLPIPRLWGMAIAGVCLWSTYAMTNLYIRAAIPEFFACAFLVSATACLIRLKYETDTRDQLATALRFTVFACLMAGSHPPTAIIGSPLLVLLMIVLRSWESLPTSASRIGVAALLGMLITIIFSPWLYITWKYGSSVFVSSKYTLLDFNGCVRGSAWEYVIPLFRSSASYANATPFLDAPVDLSGLILLFLASGLNLSSQSSRPPTNRTGLGLWVLGCLWAFTFSLFAFFAPLRNLLWWCAPFVQFSYRFITQANVGIFIALIGALSFQPQLQNRGRWLAAVFVISLFCLTVKLCDAFQIMHLQKDARFDVSGARSEILKRPCIDAAADYSVQKGKSIVTRTAAESTASYELPVSDESIHFAEAGALQIDIPSQQWVRINVVPFPFNSLWVDGQPPQEEKAIQKDFRTLIQLSPGAHRIEWRWVSPRLYSTWRAVGIWCFMALFIVGVVPGFRLRTKTDKTAL